MPPRFEVVSEPLEDRLQKSLTSQLQSTLTTFHSAASFVTNNTNNILSDHEFVARVSGTAVTLLSPRSLPGCFFALAIVVRIVRAFMISRMAHKAVAKQNEAKSL